MALLGAKWLKRSRALQQLRACSSAPERLARLGWEGARRGGEEQEDAALAVLLVGLLTLLLGLHTGSAVRAVPNPAAIQAARGVLVCFLPAKC